MNKQKYKGQMEFKHKMWQLLDKIPVHTLEVKKE
jgi:hypothetical protein